MAKHLKLHSFTGTSDHDFTGLISGQIIKYNGTTVESSDNVSSFSATTLSGGTILSGGTDLYDIFATASIGADYVPLTGTSTNVSGDIVFDDDVNLSFNAGGDNISYDSAGGDLTIETSDQLVIDTTNGADFISGPILSAGTDLYDIFITEDQGGAFSSSTASRIYPSVINGHSVGSDNSSVVGGKSNTIESSAAYSTVAGGYFNKIESGSSRSFIGAGTANYIRSNSSYSVIAGGGFNAIATGSSRSFIGGGNNVQILNDSPYSVAAGGKSNTASNNYTTVGGGYNNTASGFYSVIAGGVNNSATGTTGTVGGGQTNKAAGNYSSVVGGSSNTASGQRAFIGGGQSNLASGADTSIIGGQNNTTSHSNSHAIGSNITSVSADTTHVEKLNVKTLNGTTAATVLAVDANGQVVDGAALVTAASATASNGLTKTGANITLGGALTASTTVDAAGNEFHITNGDVISIESADNLTLAGTQDVILSGAVGGVTVNGAGFNVAQGYMQSGGTDLYSIFSTSAGVTGSGTNNTIAMWNGASTITDSIMTFDGTTGITVAGDVFIEGSVEVLGTATTINTQDLFVADNTITLNSGGTATSATSGGIIIEDGVNNGTDASWTIDANGNWQTDNGITSSAMTVSNGNLNVTGGGEIQSGGTDLYDIFTQDLQSVMNEGSTSTVETDVTIARSFTGSSAISRLALQEAIGNEFASLMVTDGLSASTFQAGLNTSIQMRFAQGLSSTQSIAFNGTAMQVNDTAQNKGLEYIGNYHANYINRSLVDKEYVDNSIASGDTTVTASNGLTKTGDNITLGGALTADTTVTTGANGLYADAGATGNILFSGNGGSFTQISLENSLNPTIPVSVNVGKGVASMLSKSGTTSTAILNGGLQASMYYEDAAFNQRAIGVSDSQMFIQDDIDSKGIDYANNYHANYTNRTLVDKEYVDNNIATGVTGFVTGSGTDNTVPLWNGTDALDDSILSQAGTTMTAAGDMIVTGDFTVNGTTTTIDTQTLQAADNNIELNLSGNNTSATGGGMTVLSGVSNSTDATWLIDGAGNWEANAGIQGTTVTATEFFAMVPYTGAVTSNDNDAWFHSGATGTITLNYQVGGTVYGVELSN